MSRQELIERTSWPRLVLLGGSVAATLVAALAIPSTWLVDGILGGLALAVGWVTVLAVRERRRLDDLPLEIGPHAVTGFVSGVETIQFRACLGLGRVVREPQLEVCWRTSGDESIPLVAHVVHPLLCGAWTVLVPDPDGLCVGDGQLDVRVVVGRGGRRWTAERSWDRSLIRRGRFAPAVRRVRGRLSFDHDHWGDVELPPMAG